MATMPYTQMVAALRDNGSVLYRGVTITQIAALPDQAQIDADDAADAAARARAQGVALLHAVGDPDPPPNATVITRSSGAPTGWVLDPPAGVGGAPIWPSMAYDGDFSMDPAWLATIYYMDSSGKAVQGTFPPMDGLEHAILIVNTGAASTLIGGTTGFFGADTVDGQATYALADGEVLIVVAEVGVPTGDWKKVFSSIDVPVPAPVPTGATIPADYGLMAWSLAPEVAASNNSVTVAILWLTKIWVPTTFTCQNLLFVIQSVPGGFTANQNFVGLYDAAGNLLFGSTAGAMDTVFASTGLKSVATGGVPLTVGTFVWFAFLWNGNSTPTLKMPGTITTMPAALLNAGLTTATSRAAIITGGPTSLPNPIHPGVITPTVPIYWAALS